MEVIYSCSSKDYEPGEAKSQRERGDMAEQQKCIWPRAADENIMEKRKIFTSDPVICEFTLRIPGE